ncbi:MAG: disulfide bond formation protein B [Candidatus Paracaedibacteraceae bacterium]|nr:disulfide bond formation protein B [Candidatus Paracaedibacteraceae bacterium]
MGFVFIAQYGFSIQPCEWCIYQRYPYILLLLLNLLWMVRSIKTCIQHIFNISILIGNVILPFIHVLIEKGYLHVKCDVLTMDRTVQGMLQTLSRYRSCVKVTWEFLGCSTSVWHLIFASGMLVAYVLGVIYEKKRYSSNRPS